MQSLPAKKPFTCLTWNDTLTEIRLVSLSGPHYRNFGLICPLKFSSNGGISVSILFSFSKNICMTAVCRPEAAPSHTVCHLSCCPECRAHVRSTTPQSRQSTVLSVLSYVVTQDCRCKSNTPGAVPAPLHSQSAFGHRWSLNPSHPCDELSLR